MATSMEMSFNLDLITMTQKIMFSWKFTKSFYSQFIFNSVYTCKILSEQDIKFLLSYLVTEV